MRFDMTIPMRRATTEGLLLALLLGTGCSATVVEITTERTDVGYRMQDQDVIAHLAQGEARSKGEVLSQFGPPVTVIPQSRGDVFVYRCQVYDTQTVNLNPSLFTGVPSPSVYTNADSSRRDDLLMIFFDAHGQSYGAAFSRGTANTEDSRAAKIGRIVEGITK
jgi:hypothetical protein